MKPERGEFASTNKNEQDCEQMKPEQKQIAMTDDEKVVFNILKANSPIDLVELKTQSGLSNKKWDKTIKGLTGTNWPRSLKPMMVCLLKWFKY